MSMHSYRAVAYVYIDLWAAMESSHCLWMSMDVYIKGGPCYGVYGCYEVYVVLYNAIIAVYSNVVFPDVMDMDQNSIF
jgi:hypothetical protein